jgi:putative GTP pyrophosphokinase
MAEWVKREYSKSQINKAGDILGRWWDGLPARTMANMDQAEKDDIGWAWGVAQNWRASHAMPLLTFRMGLTQRAKKVQPRAIVAQRMKRMSSILNKLGREQNMQLSQMCVFRPS